MSGHRRGKDPPPRKKPKRSKGFWAQRKTQKLAEIPELERETNDDSNFCNSEVVPAITQHESLIYAFSTSKAVDQFGRWTKKDVSEVEEEEGEVESNELKQFEEESRELDEKRSYGKDITDFVERRFSTGKEVASETEEEEDEGDSEDVDLEEEEGKESEERQSEEEEITELTEDGFSDEEVGEDSNRDNAGVGSSDDPFIAKFTAEFNGVVKDALESKRYENQTYVWSKLGRISCQNLHLKGTEKDPENQAHEMQLALRDEDDNEDRLKSIEMQKKQISGDLVKLESWHEGFLKAQLQKNRCLANEATVRKSLPSASPDDLSVFQLELFSLLASYKDVFYSERSFENGEKLRFVYTLHALNHMLKTRTKIIKNNERLAAVKSHKKKLSLSVRDQGLCRPRVLIVVPFKESARRIVYLMEKLLFGSKKSCVANMKRFVEDYGSENDGIAAQSSKSEDYNETFAGNTDDGFKLGLAVTKKALKLYTDFYSSDIIIASPLGLRMVIGVEGEKDRDFDFLTSIEILIMDQVDVFTMQNWEHVARIFQHLHLQPTQSHEVDFSRVRMWSLNQLSKFYRQTLLFSSTVLPELNSVFNRQCFNFGGKIKIANPVTSGSICRVVIDSVPIVFRRFKSNSVTGSIDDRFEYFTKKVMPDFSQDSMYHTLVFLPSYFDFVQLRNWFQKKSYMDFAEISEYTKYKNMAAARDRFFHGEHHFLLYTERAHFYRRYAIKGIRHLIFYQLPQSPVLFADMCNLMQAAYQNPKGGSDGNMSCTVIYNKYDVHRLSASVGSDRTKTMLTSDKTIHMFTTGKG